MTNPMTDADMLDQLEYGLDCIRSNEPALFTSDQIHGTKLVQQVIESLRVRVEAEASANKTQSIMQNPALTFEEKMLLIEHYKLLAKDKDHA